MSRVRIVASSVIVLIAITIVAIPLGSSITNQSRLAQINATYSAAASLASAIDRFYVPTADQSGWRIVTDDEYNTFVRALKDAGAFLDMSPSCRIQSCTFCDWWGNPFGIAIKVEANGHVDSIVWSKGYDGIWGTDDDVVVPTSMKDKAHELSRAWKK
jgi:hypothetical protein